MSPFTRNTLITACILATLAIALGAFAAHGLTGVLSEKQLANFHTGVRYHFFHVFALIVTAMLSQHFPKIGFRWPARLFLGGILLFSGSIYLLATASLHGLPTRILGPMTPVGGLMFMAGWVVLTSKLLSYTPQKDHGRSELK